jgi:hypothetical protein
VISLICLLQAAAEQAPKLTKEEVAAMRRANDPNFKKGGRQALYTTVHQNPLLCCLTLNNFGMLRKWFEFFRGEQYESYRRA